MCIRDRYGTDGGKNHDLPGQFPIPVHLLGHSKGGNGGRSPQHGEKGSQLDASVAHKNAKGQEQGWEKNKLYRDCDGERLNISLQGREFEGSSQNQEGHRRSHARKIRYSFFDTLRQAYTA